MPLCIIFYFSHNSFYPYGSKPNHFSLQKTIEDKPEILSDGKEQSCKRIKRTHDPEVLTYLFDHWSMLCYIAFLT